MNLLRTITVAMAIYRPNIKWLKEELLSLQKQTFRDFQILVWNDDPADSYDYYRMFQEYFSDIPFEIYQGTENLGSNKAFEKLTSLTQTKYIAYCDQDDIWKPEKLQTSWELLQNDGTNLVYSDTAVIDANSQPLYNDISYVRPRQKYYEQNVLQHLLIKNFVTGCTILMPSAVAKKAMPFPDSVFHDWWLAIAAAMQGNLVKAPHPLIDYRIYGNNQSGILRGVEDKATYYQNYLQPYYQFISAVRKKYPENPSVEPYMAWGEARKRYFKTPSLKNAKDLLVMKKLASETVYFELLLPWFPDQVFKKILKRIKGKYN